MFLGKTKVEYLIVGLGNPGKQYENTRHNVGFAVLDRLAEDMGVSINKSKFQALTATGNLGGKGVMLMKPQTFMNLSGRAVAEAANFYKIPVEKILVVFDDISLDVGRLRIRQDGSPGGHNGIKSIIGMMMSQNFPRLKVGVGAKPHPDYDLADWVLSKFSASEQKTLVPALDKAVEGLHLFFERSAQDATAFCNKK